MSAVKTLIAIVQAAVELLMPKAGRGTAERRMSASEAARFFADTLVLYECLQVSEHGHATATEDVPVQKLVLNSRTHQTRDQFTNL